MKIFHIANQNEWDAFISSHAPHDRGFLQSWEWGEFQKAYGRKVWRLGVLDGEKLVAGWQIIRITLIGRWGYFYVPRPFQNQESPHQSRKRDGSGQAGIPAPVPQAGRFGAGRNQEFFTYISHFAKKEGAVFIRVDGGDESSEQYGFLKTNISIQSQEELIIDITKPENELLAAMKPKTRYNIRVAQKHGIRIKNPRTVRGRQESPHGSGQAGIKHNVFEDFFGLVQKTSERQRIRAHPKEYYKKMLEVLGHDGGAQLYTAEYNAKEVAAALIVYFGDTAVYLHGGSDERYKNVMAPYALHWQAICDAKREGMKFYNFGGVSQTKKSWEGITRFKTGFSPSTDFICYGTVLDFPIRPFLYSLYRLVKNVKFKNQNVPIAKRSRILDNVGTK